MAFGAWLISPEESRQSLLALFTQRAYGAYIFLLQQSSMPVHMQTACMSSRIAYLSLSLSILFLASLYQGLLLASLQEVYD